MTKFVFCINALDNSGPSKGLVALANGLCESSEVIIIYYKYQKYHEYSNFHSINKKIKILEGSRANIRALRITQERTQVISMCFRSDFLTLIYFRKFKKNIYIRGNLFKNYWHDYNVLGIILAIIHYQIARFYDKILVLNLDEFTRLKKMFLKSTIVPNCLDETFHSEVSYLEKAEWDIIFVGNLNTRKRVHLIVQAVSEIKNNFGICLNAVIVGEGPQKANIKALADKLKVGHLIDLRGSQNNPEYFLSRSKIFVLPSTSEGTSRAAMEALWYGNFCVLSDIPSSKGLVVEGKTGFLFSNTDDLATKILEAYYQVNNSDYVRQNFLPEELRQLGVVGSLNRLLRD